MLKSPRWFPRPEIQAPLPGSPVPARRARLAACSGRRAGQEARPQVTGKLLPALFSDPVSALVRLELSIMVSWSSVNEEMVPAVLPSVTLALDAVHDPKFARGRMLLPLLGASAIHSALLFAQLEQVSVLVKLFAVCVESVTVSV